VNAPKVVVIGAGVIGLFCALKLVEGGADVTVIDGGGEDWSERGASASRAAAGMLAPVSESLAQHEHAHPRTDALARASFALWRRTPDWLSAHTTFGGALLLGAHAAADGVQTIAKAEALRRFGLALAEDNVGFLGEEGVVDPIPALRAIVERLRRLGARVHYELEAREIEERPWRRVRCFGGATLSADHVVIAPGIWARESIQEAAPALQHLRPAKGALAPVFLTAPLGVTVRAPDFYLAPRGRGEAVLGATMEFGVYDRRADPEKVAALLAAADRALPGQVAPGLGPAWAGIRPMSPDWSPMIGSAGAPGRWLAAGHSRNGWLLAPITAEIIAAYIRDEAPPPLAPAFSPDRFETHA
jgi:glycine oxidase